MLAHERVCFSARSYSHPLVDLTLLQCAHDMLQGAGPGLDLNALGPPAPGRAVGAGTLAACPVLAEDAGQSALGAALALQAALCGARCPPLQHPGTPGSSGLASAAPAGPNPPAEEDVAPGAEARLPKRCRGIACGCAGSGGFLRVGSASGARGRGGAAAADAASERQVVLLQAPSLAFSIQE